MRKLSLFLTILLMSALCYGQGTIVKRAITYPVCPIRAGSYALGTDSVLNDSLRRFDLSHLATEDWVDLNYIELGQAVTAITVGQGLTSSVNPIRDTGTIYLPPLGTAGTYGSSTTVPVITTDAWGRVTGVVNTAISAGTVTSVTAGSGLSGGSITSVGTISMPNVGTAGTYGSSTTVPVITTDAQGRVTGVTSISITGSTPTLQAVMGAGATSTVAATFNGTSGAVNFHTTLDWYGVHSSYNSNSFVDVGCDLSGNPCINMQAYAAGYHTYLRPNSTFPVGDQNIYLPTNGGTLLRREDSTSFYQTSAAVNTAIGAAVGNGIAHGTVTLGLGTGTATVVDAKCKTTSAVTVSPDVPGGSPLGTGYKCVAGSGSWTVTAINTTGATVTTDNSKLNYHIDY